MFAIVFLTCVLF